MDGSEIRRLREARGLTQQELATAIGVGQRTVGNWERGETIPKNRMGMLRDFFGITSSGEPHPIRSASEVTLLTELLRRAAERERRVG
jgi:transcriptional regulator with XRE-family HTH domain